MVNGTTCTVILLTKSSSTPYTISKTMHVRSTKIVIGHPIDIPQLKPAKGVERMFEGKRDEGYKGGSESCAADIHAHIPATDGRTADL